MKKIKLTQGKYALVDNEDFEWLNEVKWFFDGNYAARKSPKKIYMHRLINQTSRDFETDHINRDKLDNRKCNLRSVTSSQNSLNLTVRKDNRSGVTGVFWRKDRQKWSVYINKDGKRTYLGHHKTREEALKIREQVTKEYMYA